MIASSSAWSISPSSLKIICHLAKIHGKKTLLANSGDTLVIEWFLTFFSLSVVLEEGSCFFMLPFPAFSPFKAVFFPYLKWGLYSLCGLQSLLRKFCDFRLHKSNWFDMTCRWPCNTRQRLLVAPGHRLYAWVVSRFIKKRFFFSLLNCFL